MYKLIALTIWEGNDKNSLEDYILIRKMYFSYHFSTKKRVLFQVLKNNPSVV